MQRMKVASSMVSRHTLTELARREQMFILPRSQLITYEEMQDEQAKIGISDAAGYWIDYIRNNGKQLEDVSLLFTVAQIVQHDEFDPVVAATPL
jgi:hypothetical protein